VRYCRNWNFSLKQRVFHLSKLIFEVNKKFS
jgi:hypothetical protein